MENILELKTINSLQENNFFIPSYQRGYRWSNIEVIDLLNDIADFKPRQVEDSDEKTWYCLQPIVVKRKDDGLFEVIDGQQRLTSIYLVLHYLNQIYTEENRQKLFELHYETRSGSSTFLSKLKKDVSSDDNIDFYYISEAYKAITLWFNKPNFNRNDFESKFKFNTKVIWYESFEIDPIAIFTRINIGKIPLTNAELIKALFLNSSNFEKNKDRIRLKQLEISTEWDTIEHALQNDRFWYFINGKKASTNRIEFIFDLMNDEKDNTDTYSTFRFFNKKFQNKSFSVIEKNWAEIKKYFQRFNEWFQERDLYHKIGFLITTDSLTIKDLYEVSANKSKSEFKEFLDDTIKNNFKGVSLENVQYGDKSVKRILLLYNILTMLSNKKDNSFFPFDIFKNGKWDIEHITSVKDTIPDNKTQWLTDAKAFIDTDKKEGRQLKRRADECDCTDENVFNSLFTDIVSHFNSNLKDEDINDISNLTLLDSETNRGYKNAVFPLKRKTIITREKDGTFIPLCTKNVFLKYFSDYPPKISFWTQEDRDNYFKDLEKVLANYINRF
ncbi:DUF262 domain-containing protein [Mucilaginibacter achroorhodeus]|uniref:DUF262 domain-containing protein n=1 Tax=Mucilaginibacter achroorhodeus TaxID=2599294 RepID=A0A563U1K3_9SPHI|nr:DUF262 domain-containing protein [Mucilaginibacter achroorhodeus]TWR25494.1 DUF262 domain-containing protein [Mucilaginibacter achroorhodeus]